MFVMSQKRRQQLADLVSIVIICGLLWLLDVAARLMMWLVT